MTTFKRGSEKKKGEPKSSKQLGIQIRVDLWRRFRILALNEGKTGTALMEEAMTEYLQRHEDEAKGNGRI